MVTRVGGFRRKTRKKLSRHMRKRGKLSITNYLQILAEGDKVQLVADSIVQKGMYHPRFHGKAGSVVGSQGECYRVHIQDGGKDKILIVHPIHLRRSV